MPLQRFRPVRLGLVLMVVLFLAQRPAKGALPPGFMVASTP